MLDLRGIGLTWAGLFMGWAGHLLGMDWARHWLRMICADYGLFWVWSGQHMVSALFLRAVLVMG
jgi:hypothetical protein